jgi:hypothetical protein
MNPEALERYVDADEAGKFLSLTRRRILELARVGKLPGHPVGDGARHIWLFRLSELASAVAKNVFTSQHDPVIRNPTASSCRGTQETSSR